jgi:peptidoglycan/LPS O-acetylase OafA/YrhL
MRFESRGAERGSVQTGAAATALAGDGTTHLLFLDGIRGLAALYVFFQHLQLEVTFRNPLPKAFIAATKWLQMGHYAVDVFIVLSGYSLMLPVARSRTGSLKGGTLQYLRRRSRRILPPYFAALAFSLGLILLVPGLRRPTGNPWDFTLPNLTPGPVLSHLLLVHNLNDQWAMKINTPMWSVATEWQIYFLFPLLLLPLWRRAGIVVTVLVGYGVGVGLFYAWGGHLSYAYPWYIGLFAMGMAAAMVGFSVDPRAVAARDRWPWGAITLLLGAVVAAMTKFRPGNLIVIDAVAGLAASGLLVTLARRTFAGAPRGILLRLFESRGAVALGAVSYTLYLVHAPLIALAHLWLQRVTELTPMKRVLLVPALTIILTVPVTLVIHVLFERPFMRGHPRSAAKAAVSAAVDPAP